MRVNIYRYIIYYKNRVFIETVNLRLVLVFRFRDLASENCDLIFPGKKKNPGFLVSWEKKSPVRSNSEAAPISIPRRILAFPHPFQSSSLQYSASVLKKNASVFDSVGLLLSFFLVFL
ncbi:hypothetical protein L1049_028455 [Liquidambar formosana]|uniref:Uncharacterized protein n=1 Tax=Liquidambar formosana TaxID=63359 RepID=A0AAP0WW96_LIQFO